MKGLKSTDALHPHQTEGSDVLRHQRPDCVYHFCCDFEVYQGSVWEKQAGDFEQDRGMGFQVSLLSLALKLGTSLYLIIKME